MKSALANRYFAISLFSCFGDPDPLQPNEPYGESLCFQGISLRNDPYNYLDTFILYLTLDLKGF
jgi:hypothetical protein